ncbi:sigma-70 family RNA polymerase sigma factor [Candidatus Margulisiibacteriota bacterium]
MKKVLIDELVIQYQKKHRARTRKKIIDETSACVFFIAKKFQYRGESLDDLVQVGTIGLLKAIDNFDSSLGNKFLTYATSVIVGEIKHHFRDHSPIIKIPRRVHERYASIQAAIKNMITTQRKSPTITDIAKEMDISEELILDCLSAAESYRSLSLDAPLEGLRGSNDETIPLIEAINASDADISDVIINREGMKKAMEHITKKEKKVLYYTFYLNLNQAQIARRMHFSQAHVSRILIHSLAKLRRSFKR